MQSKQIFRKKRNYLATKIPDEANITLQHTHFAPQPVVRKRCLGVYLLLRHWMHKLYLACQERYASVGIAAPCAILKVALYLIHVDCLLATYLMVASGHQINLNERIIVRTAYHLVVQHGFL